MTENSCSDADLNAAVCGLLERESEKLGLVFAGAAGVETDSAFLCAYRKWLDEGCAGEMGYLREHFPLIRNACSLLPRARSVLIFALPWPFPGKDCPPENGFISSYARGRDYHRVMRSKLRKIAVSLSALCPGASFRAAADSAPVPEVEKAAETNFGRRGRNSLLISERTGSAFFLGEIVTDALIRKIFPEPADPCRGCMRCVRRCPGHAIRGDGFIDARKCVSYLTIEFHGAFTDEESLSVGGRVYGCDECLLACPWNRRRRAGSFDSDFTERGALLNLTLRDKLMLSEDDFLRLTEGSAIRRIGYLQWLRNTACALGNLSSDTDDIPLLESRSGLSEPLDAEIRRAAAKITLRAGARDKTSRTL